MTRHDPDDRTRTAAAVYLFHGDDEYPRDEAARDCVRSLIPESDQALGLEILEGKALGADEAAALLGRCVAALQTPAFLGLRKVVWLRDVTFLASSAILQSVPVKAGIGGLIACLADPARVATLVITAVGIDKRSILFRACGAHGRVTAFDVPEKRYQVDAQARDRIRQALHARGLGASDAVVEAFLQRVGTDARTIASEADKLAAYLGDRAVVRPEDIRAVTSPGREAAAWDLADAMGGKDLAGTLAELRMLLDQREAPLGLMALLASRFRDLALYREALDKGWLTLRPGARGGQTAEWKCLPPALENACESGVVADPRRVHPYRATCLAVQASLYTAAELARIQGIIVETYERLLSGSVPDALAMELLVLRAMGRG